MQLNEAMEDILALSELPGRKVLLRGNHDYWWTTARKMERYLTENGFDTMHILHNNACMVGDYALCGTRGWPFDDTNAQDAKIMAREAGRLRMSLVRDALFDRANTGDNTPAFCELKLVPGDSATLHVLLKGGGSDNASRVVMLPPGAGADSVRRVVLDCVREKAANACPPLVIGLGVGATFDKVAGLAKHCLLYTSPSPRDA